MTIHVSAADDGPASGVAVIGPVARTARADRADAWLSGLFEQSGGTSSGACLVAVGGYGRRDMAPGSDLDVFLLHPDDVAVDALAEALWYPVWDAGVRLDHSVRTVAEARHLAARDPAVLIGLLDGRVVSGDESLWTTLRTQVLGDWRAMATARLADLRSLVDARRQRSGDLAHLLEPDLKESYGGLRDATVLRAISASWVADAPHADVETAAGVLLDVRDALHLATGRATDRLVQQEQDAVVALLAPVRPLDGRDDLLRTVSRAARTLAVASEATWHAVERASRRTSLLRRLAPAARNRAPLAEGVVVQDEVAVLAADADPANDPVLVLRAAAAAAQADLRLSPHAVARLAAESASMPEPWPREARDALVSLLSAGRSTLPVWEALDQAGLISGLIPEWEVVRGAPQRDPLHRFTVDRHLLEAAIQASSMARRVPRPDLLVVGALLHDIGKARGRDHTAVGVELVDRIAPRMGFDRDDAAVLVDLVRWHLLLPQLATRRDIDDPATARAVSERISDPGTVDLLHALAIADAHATGPQASSEWRLSLIDALVARVHAVIGGTVEPVAPVVMHEGPLPEGDAVALTITEVERPFLRIDIAVHDQRGLLAAIALVLSMHRLDVRAARTESIGDHAVMQWFVTPQFGDAPDTARLREDVRLVLAGALDPAARIRAGASGNGTAPPLVRIHPGASDRATVLEVRAHDRPGLLGRLAAAITALGLDVTGARVDTLGSEVVDVFYVIGPDRRPLEAPAALRLQEAVEAALTVV